MPNNNIVGIVISSAAVITVCVSVCLSVCLFVCVFVCVSVFLTNGHSFERICTKFGTLRPYALRMLMGVGGGGVGERRSLSRNLRAVCMLLPIVDI